MTDEQKYNPKPKREKSKKTVKRKKTKKTVKRIDGTDWDSFED